jgi:chromosome segregation ATPase
MKMKVLFPLVLVLMFVCSAAAQSDRAGFTPPQQMPLDPMANISMELTNISRSVAQLSERLKLFVDKFEKVGGLTLSEKQQRFIMGLELLVRSEQRVATLQKAHTELIEKHIQVRRRLTEIDLELRPQSIERTTQLEGSTQTIEIRENRRDRLVAEQRSLTTLINQIERNINEAEFALREAQAHVTRLRRTLLPQIEREIEGTGN